MSKQTKYLSILVLLAISIFALGFNLGTFFNEKQDTSQSVLSRAKTLIDVSALSVLQEKVGISDSVLNVYVECYAPNVFCPDKVQLDAWDFLQPLTGDVKKELSQAHLEFRKEKQTFIQYLQMSANLIWIALFG